MTDKPKKKSKNKIVALLVVICLLFAALAVCAVLYIKDVRETNQIMNNTLVLEGVSVNGVDISNMTEEQAMEATSDIPSKLLEEIKITVDVDGEIFSFDADDFGIVTDYEEVMRQAVEYGHSDSIEERKQAIATAKSGGAEFTVSIYTDREKVASVIMPLKETLDIQPVDASFTFSPWGFLADGTPFEQDKQTVIEACARGREWERPELIRIPEEEMPNRLRYQFWENDHYEKDYIPKDANIARFLYTEGVTGRSVDMEAVVDSIMSSIQKGDYSPIKAPVEVLEPAVKVEDLKAKTQLISSWTSSYSNHEGFNRNWNVAKLSGIINGVILEPGIEWSINEEAGPRREGMGWKEAAGIIDGGYVQEFGGGVCQISSTLYNAAIRSALEITDSTHHSIRSDYIPYGLDATISTGGPDLKLKNPYDTPVYIVSYVNPKHQNVTVEMYGPPVVDPELGEVILNFSFEDGGHFGAPVMIYIYNTAVAPDKTPINPGDSYEYAKARQGSRVKTYIHYLSLDGTELKKKSFHNYEWKPINGKTYVNGPDPALGMPYPTYPWEDPFEPEPDPIIVP
ncbi:MAG: Vancomycin B-type resistance protein VanW [Firmicutes bacterium ADurb.Bin182]|nr:MAG: Vancomycin B-type resistance protein VanW [Firmicutes bacterium ADurb.Bin182]